MTAQTSTEFCLSTSCEGTTLDSSDQDQFDKDQSDTTDLVTNSSAGSLAQIAMYSQFVIIPVGLILNVFCFIVLVKSKIAQTATGIHLTFLAVADILVLLTIFVFVSDDWSRHIAIPGLRNGYSFICKMALFTINVGFLWSGLLLASATVERFLSVAFPLKVKSWGLYKISKILMIFYLIGSLVLCSYSVLCHEFIPLEDGINICAFTQKEINVKICNICDTIVNFVLSNIACVLVIFTFTVMVTTRLLKYKNKRSELGHGGGSGKEFQSSVMLVVVATLFLILRIPEMIAYQIIYFFLAKDALNPTLNNILTAYPIFVTFLALNHSINFLIYITFLNNFRQTFKGLHKCMKSGTQSGISGTSSASLTHWIIFVPACFK